MHNSYLSTQNLLKREISRFSAMLFLAAALAVTAGCGSGQAPAGPAAPPVVDPATGPAVASIQLLASSTQIPSSGATTVDLTAVTLSASKQTLSGKTVVLAATSDLGAAETAYVETPAVTDDAGSTTTKLHLGTNRTNRTLTITATAEGATTTNNINVVGTTIKVSGNTSVAFGDDTKLTISVKDSDGTPLQNTPVTVTSQYDNAIVLSPASGLTDTKGEIMATVSATKTGTGADANADNLALGAAGASTTQRLAISTDSLKFQAPSLASGASSIDLTLNSAHTVSVNWTTAGVAQAGKPVNFSVSRGTITASATTDAAGDTPAVTVSSSTAGPAIITASATGSDGSPLATTLDVVFVATTANTATVQAVPGTIQVTTGATSQTSNSSTISVQVRDKDNNLVKNAAVDFTITADLSNGSLSSGQAVTDVNGTASVTYTAGAASDNAVKIQATVTKVNGAAITPTVVGTTTLTVANQPLLVRIGTDNLLATNTPLPTYTKTFAAVVTDAAGNSQAGVTVYFKMRPGRYWKGYYVFDSAALNRWVQVITTPGPDDTPAGLARCANEDTNFNSILDKPPTVLVDEDFNNNGSLEPGNVASITGSAVTDDSGIAYAAVTYPKDHAWWTEEIVEARTGVSSNDPPAQYTFVLEGLGSDYTDQTVIPPGYISPYGYGSKNTTPPGYQDCSNSN